MVRIIKKQDEAYFSLNATPYKYANKTLTKLDENDPYYHVLMGYELLKEEIIENEDTIEIGDVSYNKMTEEIENEEAMNDVQENAILFMNESEEVEGDENSVTVDEDIISVDPEAEPVEGEEIEPTVEPVQQDEEVDEEVENEKELILKKVEKIEKNIKNLESADINTDDDLQNFYLQEVGKKALLQERLKELGVDGQDKKQTILDKISESVTYPQFKKSSTVSRLMERYKMGSKVMAKAIDNSKSRFLESIKEQRHFESEDGLVIDYNPEDDKFVMSGDMKEFTEEEILVVEEKDFFQVFDSIVKEIDDIKPLSEEVTPDTMGIKEPIPSIPTKVDDGVSDGKLVLKDGEYYVTKCDVYSDSMGNQSDKMGIESFLLARAGYVMQYIAEENILIDEDGNIFDIQPEYLSHHENPVSPQSLEENEELIIVDDENQPHDVIYEGIQNDESIGELYEFKNRFKESVFIPKSQVISRLRRQ